MRAFISKRNLLGALAVVGVWVVMAVILYIANLQRRAEVAESRVTFSKGEVSFFAAGGERLRLKVGARVPVGTRVVVGEKSEVDLGLGDFGALKVDAGSELKIELLERDGERLEVGLDLKRGRVFNKLRKLGGGAEFRLKAPSGQIVVRGTEFFVESDGKKTLTAVRSGTVGASADQGGASAMVAAEEMVSMTPDGIGPVEAITQRERRLFASFDRIIGAVAGGGGPPTEQWVTLLASDANDFEGWEVLKGGDPADPVIADGVVSIALKEKGQMVRIEREINPVRDLVFGGRLEWGQTNGEVVVIEMRTSDGGIISVYTYSGGYWGFQMRRGETSEKPKNGLSISTGYNPVSHAGTQIDEDGYITLQVAKFGKVVALFAGGRLLGHASFENDVTIESVRFGYSQREAEPIATTFRDWRVCYPAETGEADGERWEVDYWRTFRGIARAQGIDERLQRLRQAVLAFPQREEFWYMLARAFEEKGEPRAAAAIYRRPYQMGKKLWNRAGAQRQAYGQIYREHLARIAAEHLIPDAGAGLPPLIAKGAVWRYADRPEGDAWPTLAFDDSAWQRGAAVFGDGGVPGITTTVGPAEGAAVGDLPQVVHFRHTFEMGASDRLGGLYVHLRGDDGAAVYLNGKEIARHNLPSGKLAPDANATKAPKPEELGQYRAFILSGEHSLAGRNVLAVSVHRAKRGSQGLSFDLQLSAISDLMRGAKRAVGLPDAVWDELRHGTGRGDENKKSK